MVEVVPALKKFLLDHSDEIDDALKPFKMKLKDIYKYESFNLDVESLPAICIGNGTVEKQWVAAHYMQELTYTLELFGYIVHDDTEKNADAIRAFADAVSRVFELRVAETIPIPNKSYVIHYHSVPPLKAYEIGYEEQETTFLRMWSATWVGHIDRSAGYQE